MSFCEKMLNLYGCDGSYFMDSAASQKVLEQSKDELGTLFGPRRYLAKHPDAVVYCPVSVNNRHSILLVLRNKDKTLVVYDPKGSPCSGTTERFLDFLGAD